MVFSRAFSGILDSSAAAGSSDLGWEREAPFGVPVVPDVRMIAFPGSPGGTTSERSPPSISASRVASRLSESGSSQAR